MNSHLTVHGARSHMMPIPTEVHEFTTDWFNDVLGTEQEPSRIVDSTVSAHAAPGQTAEIYFAKLSYDRLGARAPRPAGS